MFDNMTFDPATAFAPVTVLVRSPLLLEVPARLPVKTYAEFVAFAKANSGKLNHASPGAGTQAHLATELFRAMIGFDSQHIAYRGNGPMSQGMMQGEPDWEALGTEDRHSANRSPRLEHASPSPRAHVGGVSQTDQDFGTAASRSLRWLFLSQRAHVGEVRQVDQCFGTAAF